MTTRPILWPALVLWGVQMELPWLGVLVGLLFEGVRWTRFRLDISLRDFERLWSFTAVLFLGVVFYLLLADRGMGMVGSVLGQPEAAPPLEANLVDGLPRISTTALVFLHGLPLILLPFTLVHAWSTRPTLPWSTFSLYEQARARREPLVAPPAWALAPMQPALAYQGLVLFSATTLPDPGPWFLPCWVVAVMAALWPWRPQQHGVVTWTGIAGLLAVVALMARSSHDVTRQAWDLLEQGLQRGYLAGTGELQRRGTALGSVGRLQESATILVRGECPPGQPPHHVAEGIFDRFSGLSWESSARTWAPVQVEVGPLDPQRLTISRPTDHGHVPLLWADDARQVTLPSALPVESNGLGSLRFTEAPPLVTYQVAPGGPAVAPPTPDDVDIEAIPSEDVAAVRDIMATISPPLIPAVTAWLADHCTYTLEQAAPPLGVPPIAHFLRTRRQGHCEYFAAAAVLMLRQGGIPARYVVGFVPEVTGTTWVARGRNAHAWVMAWDGQRWQTVDPTPPDWQKQRQSSWWERVADGWSWVVWQYDGWRAHGGDGRLVVLLAGLAVLLWIGWRQVRGSRWERQRGATRRALVPGATSPLLAYVRRLEAQRGARPVGMPLRAWLATHGVQGEVVDLHERWRFAPGGLVHDEQARLAQLVHALPPPGR